MTRNDVRCAVCDGWYSSKNIDAVKEHRHPEPQSGPPRDAWLRSGLSYERWILETAEGEAWEFRNQGM